MVWFKVDDSLAFHRKAISAGNSAMGLWVRAGSWSAQQLTDGYVPDHVVAVLGTEAQARRLVRAGLWMEADGGYQFHQWTDDDRNPTRDEVLLRRKRDSERQQRKRGNNRPNPEAQQVTDDRPPVTHAGSHGGNHGGCPDPPTRPDPSSPKGEPPCSPPRSAKRREHEPERFAEFYDTFPRHKDRKAAARKFDQVVRDGVDPDTLIAAAARYAEEVRGTEARYVKHPATWLSKGGWLDEPDPHPAAQQPQMSTGDQRIAALQARKSGGAAADSNPFRALPGGRSA